MGFFDDMDEFAELPLAEPDPENKFEIDKNVNVETIDDYLGIPGVTYLDMRMIEEKQADNSRGSGTVTITPVVEPVN